MIDQEKRDKIIDDLQLCRCEMEYGNKDECSYFLKECLKDLHDEVIAMLRAVPRVMRLEEVKELHPDDDVYIERISSITGVHYIYIRHDYLACILKIYSVLSR